MPIDTAHQSGEEVEVATECLAHIIIKLVAVGRGMHHDDSTVETRRIRSRLLLHEVEVRHSGHIVVLRGIGVQTNEFHTGCDEREVHLAVHHAIRLIACTEEVVIADKGDIRHIQTIQDVTRPLKFLRRPRIRQVATMHDEIDVPAVYVRHLVPCVRMPQMRVADESHPQRVLVGKSRLNPRDVLRVDTSLALDVDIIRMRLEHIIARCQEQCQQRQQRSPFHGSLFICLFLYSMGVQPKCCLTNLPKNDELGMSTRWAISLADSDVLSR